MSALKKLSEARKLFHASELKKTGKNSFQGYNYFELGDFLIPALKIFHDIGLMGVVSFASEVATMTITDLEDEASFVLVTSPMSTASLKGSHEIQNLGAVQTYLRRYLWVAALEIVEHDALDSSDGAAPKKTAAKPVKATKKAEEFVPEQVARNVTDGVNKGDAKGAAEYLSSLSEADLDSVWGKLEPDIVDQLTAVWPE